MRLFRWLLGNMRLKTCALAASAEQFLLLRSACALARRGPLCRLQTTPFPVDGF